MTQNMKFNLNSLNVRGIANEKKRQTIFQWVKQNYEGVTLLQETHSLEKYEKQWKAEWGSDIIFSHGSYNSCGVAILLDSKFDYKIKDVQRDKNGRLLIVTIDINDETYVLINVYAPTKNHPNEQNIFFSILNRELSKYAGSNIIIGGDFNVCMNPEIDKMGGKKDKISSTQKQLYSMLETHDIIDAWRVLNENEKRFTWRSTTKQGRVACRLDLWLISSHLMFDIANVQIVPSIKTDHSLITLSLFLKKTPKRGKGFWKFNNSLLIDKEYISIIERFLESYEEKYDVVNNKALAWDTLKCEIRGITISYSINKAKQKRQYVEDLNMQLKNLETKLDNGEDVGDAYNAVRNELGEIEEETLRGNIIRSRAQLIEENEKCSKYFMKLVNRNYKSKCITTLLKDDQILNQQSEILVECKQFYESLYSSKQSITNLDQCQFFKNNHKSLSAAENYICESSVTEDECYETILTFSNNKSPGSDGLSVEFYKVFWHKIKTYLLNSYNYSFQNNILSLDQRRALITLIPKGNKDKRLLKNWRPISLLNSDYKILAKVLASRLQKVISGIIHPNQTGYIKGRYIGDNIRTMLDILEITKQQADPGLMILIDFEKAFDTISWNFLFKTLEYYGFGPIFLKYIKLLYTQPKCCITNNGYSTEFFNIERGIRQGCPLSALLFVLCVEVLATEIRNSESIRGIFLKHHEIKLTQFADDTCLYLNGTNSLENVIPIFEDFYRYAGLKLNVEKTEAIWLGKNNRIGKICGIKITQNPVKVLGIWICKNSDQILKLNFEERAEKFKNLLNIW